MYKVFFKDRIVFFHTNFTDTFRSNTGLFYRYGNRGELKALITAYFGLEKIPRLYIIHTDLELLMNEFKSCFRLIKAAGGVVKNSEGKIMVIKRHGLWDLPKGKTEDDESSEEAALREVREECSIKGLQLGRFIATTFHTYLLDNAPVLKEITWYEMKTEDNTPPRPQLKEDITDTIWFSPDEIGSIKGNTYPSILEVLTAADVL